MIAPSFSPLYKFLDNFSMATSTSPTSEPATTIPSGETTKNEQTYPCSCHCGSITFTVTLSPPLTEQTVMECNCSICRRVGYLLVYPPKEAVVFSEDSLPRLSRYQFNTKQIDHLFCGNCGSSLGIDFCEFRQKGYGISVRAFNNVDLEGLKYKKWDGKAKLPPYSDVSGVQWALDHPAGENERKEKAT
ncbi:Putative protein of unknown function [Podospora comata]|uniref:CENP-V/GFA domain-containing protein n=1 Tax=Podospora comata TaxID=48703 RepID=A0ABY6S6T6_PODCO|nr:Putative protein of unknown function [Podospora comata]